MAFTQNNLAKVGQQTIGGFDVYTYGIPDVDTVDDCLVAGYFSSSRFIGEADWIGSLVLLKKDTDFVVGSIQADGGSAALIDNSRTGTYRIYAKEAADLENPIPGFDYFVDGPIDMGSTPINVPSGGLTISGYGFGVSSLTSSEDGYTLFVGAAAGNLFISGVEIFVTGSGSAVFDITDSNGTHAIEWDGVNFNNCTALGTISGYRQMLENNVGRFGGTAELELDGNMNGVRITTSIVRGVTIPTALYKAGPSLLFSGRFVINQNVDLPATGAWIDFSASNFTNDESLIVDGSYVTRLGVLNAADATITPNINQDSIKSNWSGNTGVKDTQEYIRSYVSAEVVTPVALVNTYYPLNGTMTVEKSVHFDMPANGQYRLLVGAGTYLVSGDVSLAGTANDLVDLRVTKSTDGGSTWPTEVNHIRRVVNNLAGARDVAFYSLSFDVDLSAGDRLRVEVENKTAANNVTAELDSYIVILEV